MYGLQRSQSVDSLREQASSQRGDRGINNNSGQTNRPDNRWMYGLRRSQSVDSLREQASPQESESRRITSTSNDYGLSGIGADSPPQRPPVQGFSLRNLTTQILRDGAQIEYLSNNQAYPSSGQ